MVYIQDCTASIVAMAKKFYMAYCENSDNKNFRGEECPAWDDLPNPVQSHWCAVAICAFPHLNVR